MKEKEFLSVIKNIIGDKYIGDDCAYLKDLGIVVTQDSLVEGVHFLREYITPYQLGYKSVMVNLSDIAASGAECKYITISLSLPENTGDDFVRNFYLGAHTACGENIKIVGGDITGSDKVYISVCAIGAAKNRNISSRSFAKEGYKIVVAGNHGSSAAGLRLLTSDIKDNSVNNTKLIKAHFEPKAQIEFGSEIAKTVKEEYAMMDTSDGLMDALSTIADESGVCLEINFEKIPYDKDIEMFDDYEDLILYGGEDYGIVAVIPDKYNIEGGVVIGKATKGEGVNLIKDGTTAHLSRKDIEEKLFNHFK